VLQQIRQQPHPLHHQQQLQHLLKAPWKAAAANLLLLPVLLLLHTLQRKP
jgi:hypothetical protein